MVHIKKSLKKRKTTQCFGFHYCPPGRESVKQQARVPTLPELEVAEPEVRVLGVFVLFFDSCMDLKGIMPSEKSQSQKVTY